MAKLWLDRLREKYGLPEGGWTGRPYRELVNVIISKNTQNIQNKTARMSRTGWDSALRKITTKEKRFVVPDVSDVLPKRAVYVRKAADKGKILTDTLRDSLTKNLKETLNQFTPKTGEATYLRRRGEKAGTINPKLIAEYEKKITKTFHHYTKKDPSIGIPRNVHAIAVTEMRSAINEIKHEYVKKLVEKNPDLEIRKSWIHNRSLSDEPRKGHMEVSAKTMRRPIPMDEMFDVPLYRKVGGRWMPWGSTWMDCPHDSGAPPEQLIGCSCDVEYIAKKRKMK